uniref:Uncharacterized protein n=1 Tax=Terrapene triunguis TaxID=2587831 RepID=A0A674HTM7_9SAUR
IFHISSFRYKSAASCCNTDWKSDRAVGAKRLSILCALTAHPSTPTISHPSPPKTSQKEKQVKEQKEKEGKNAKRFRVGFSTAHIVDLLLFPGPIEVNGKILIDFNGAQFGQS